MGHRVCENEPSTEGCCGDLFQNLAPSLLWAHGRSQAGTTSPKVPLITPETPLRWLHLLFRSEERISMMILERGQTHLSVSAPTGQQGAARE